MKTGVLLILCVVALSACKYVDVAIPLVPFKSEITAGHKYSGEATAFLDETGTTREEVIATLGPPMGESRKSQVLVYTWQITSNIIPFQIISKDRDPVTGAETITPWSSERGGIARQWSLFIAYDDSGQIVAHEVGKTGALGLEEACDAWRRTLKR
jgi:hypothetical protein